ncbi:unnamed protein product [Aphanomyces euteiches]|uniref:SCP2 domain-containing protein n=1 Tax=Aphanomyces euteiches TaxID=100861 RepID=A0A6G0WUL6_9STRA|nr:hypothetical protein Ae201684_011470 [Aphanomyces euteiches]KAH9097096.1 hypothetical protein Ae201684P_011825 [Aphanomyces euteiches]KAH9131992.1 hypothetical protein AeRB84_021465 [Aphanomyces euteiches]
MMPSAGVCARQSAKLEELMNFLQFAVLDTPKRFKGVVVFTFFNATREVVCVRSVDTTSNVRVYASRPPPDTNAVDVGLTISDFLLMYSGELTAAEIAGLCMSGKVQLRWTAYGSLKAFADSFDFSVDKWCEFYGHFGLDPNYVEQIECTLPCCTGAPETTVEEIEANWNLVRDSVLIPAGAGALDWQLVTSLEISPMESPKKEVVAEFPSSSSTWLHLFQPHLVQVQDTVKRKMFNVKEYAEKFLVLLDE